MSAQRVGSSFQASSLCELSLSSARRHSALGETTAIMPSLMALLAKHAQLLVTQHESVLKANSNTTLGSIYICYVYIVYLRRLLYTFVCLAFNANTLRAPSMRSSLFVATVDVCTEIEL